MKLYELKELYNSHRNECCVCGCELDDYTGFGLGRIFVMDKKGNFYCAKHDSDLDVNQDDIFDEDLYEDYDDEDDIE